MGMSEDVGGRNACVYERESGWMEISISVSEMICYLLLLLEPWHSYNDDTAPLAVANVPTTNTA